MWMIWETGTKSLREIGELFGGLDYAAVAATDSSNTILSRFDWCQKVEDHNVKYLDLTPGFDAESDEWPMAAAEIRSRS